MLSWQKDDPEGIMSIKESSSEQRGLPEWVWAFPVIAPLLLILFSYILLPWSWGLMDDFQLLGIPGGIVQRAKDIFMMYFVFGEFKWTHAFHCAVFYKIFANAPGFFHIFKWAEISGMIFIWGAVAYQLTGRRIMLFLFPAIAFSFHYLYDQFFFLSTHETTGLLFLALAVLCVVRVIFVSAINTCYKVFKREVIQGICIRSRNFAFETEVTIKLILRGIRIKEVPIEYVARSHREGKKIRWGTAFEMYWQIIKYRFLPC